MINPLTGRIYGPNSHFYTADADECAGLKAQYVPNAKSWKFEGNDLLITPATAGACASGWIPVYRAYNNGFAKGFDSNHRITSNFLAYQQSVASGWVGEGIAMCALPLLPGAPQALEANSGDSAANLGWNAPANDGGAAIQGYSVTAVPAIDSASISIVGTRAILRGLANGVTYSVSVSARNAAGSGPASAAIQVTPSAVNTASYVELSILGDNSPSGIYDPSALKTSAADVWMAYSGVNYHTNSAGQLVRDVSIRLARSQDGGQTYSFVRELGTAQDATVTDAMQLVCGATKCSGRWLYETAWLVDDRTDPDATRRYKLFAHKYFFHPPSNTTAYHLGSIVMWTAADPNGNWSAETSLLGWNLTPPEATARINVNTLDSALAPCLLVGEGGASVRGSGLDFVFNCPYIVTPAANPLPQKIVLARTADHAVASPTVRFRILATRKSL